MRPTNDELLAGASAFLAEDRGATGPLEGLRPVLLGLYSMGMSKRAMHRYLESSGAITCGQAAFNRWINTHVNFAQELQQRPLDLLEPTVSERRPARSEQKPVAPPPSATGGEGIPPDSSDTSTSSTTKKTNVESASTTDSSDESIPGELRFRTLARKALAALEAQDMVAIADRVLRNPPSSTREETVATVDPQQVIRDALAEMAVKDKVALANRGLRYPSKG